MKYSLATLAFGIGASAGVLRRDDCSFTLIASGGQSGNVGQLEDGQNRVGGNLPVSQATYSINNGQITSAGKGCILTPPTTQFQCDAGATPSGGFSIGSNGALSHDGSTTFYACPATDSEYNLYTTPVENQPKCVEVALTANGCFGNGQPSSSAPQQTQPATPPPQTETQKQTETKTAPAPPPQTETKTAPAPPPQTETKTAPAPPPQTETKTAPVPPPQTETQKQTETKTAPPQTVVQTVQSSCPAPSTITETSVVVSTVEHTVTVTSVATAPAPPAQTIPVTKTASVPVAVPVPTTETAAVPVPITETQAVPVPVTPVATATQVVPAPSKPTSNQPSGSCPADLNGNYQYPHLIVPVDSSSPDKAAGTQYNGKVTSTISSIFNFDVPASYTGTCSLVFLFPEQKDLETSSFTFNGDGAIDFKQLSTVASQSTTFANQGGVATDFGAKTVTPGTSTVISTFACPAGQAVSYELSAVSGTSLEFFQDYNPSPIGLYIRTC
jgi:hypothetical protein